MLDLSRHEEVFGELRANLGAYLRDDTLAGAPPAPDVAPFLHPDAAPDERPACVMGVIDDAVPFAHPRLTVRGPDGRTHSRVASIWAMGAAREGGETRFGREWRGPAVDALLAAHAAPGAGLDEEALYRSAGLWDAARGPLHAGGRRAAHGAVVADLAAGGPPSDPAGRQRPVIAASLPPEVTRDTSGTFAPWFVLLATLHVLDRARRLAEALGRGPLPVVINLSYGVTAGPKDGSGLVESVHRLIAEEGVDGVGPVRFAVPMGNHRLGRLRGRAEPGGTLRWRVPPDDATPSFLELRGPPADAPPECGEIAFAVAPPGEAPIEGRVAHGTARELTIGGRHVARVYAGLSRTTGGRLREVLTLALPPTDAATGPEGRAGLWSIAMAGGAPFDAYIQRDDAIPGFGGGGRQMRFAGPDWDPIVELGGPVPGGPSTTEGTVNAWATGGAPWQVPVSGARPDGPESRMPGGLVPYSAFPVGVAAADDPVLEGGARAVAHRSAVRPGVPAAGTFAGTALRAAGTSVAAPQAARAMADALARGEEPPARLRPPAPPERRGY